MDNMCAKSDEDILNGLDSMVFTRWFSYFFIVTSRASVFHELYILVQFDLDSWPLTLENNKEWNCYFKQLQITIKVTNLGAM